ncbi:hypothetical protein Tco_0857090 [Tanacetum coccineum]|uniref:Uncharacterized protein n=1 Tax=Tanacetum coccineum TaxID=301880 RepID=A0ABQ5B8B6_9ASTR
MENANPFGPLVPPNAPRDRVVKELDEVLELSAMIDSRLENIDHNLIDVSPTASPEQLLHNFLDPPEYLEIDDIVSDAESVDTPLVSPFLDSDDGEVFVGSFTYIMFNVFEDIEKYIEIGLSEVVTEKPFKDLTHLEDDCSKGPEYQVDDDMKEWLTCGHVMETVLEFTTDAVRIAWRRHQPEE